MSRATVLAQVATLSLGEADPTAATRFYRDAVFDLGFVEAATTLSLIPFTSTEPPTAFALPTTAVRLLGVFYHDAMLHEATLDELAVVDRQWRERRGQPSVFVVEGEATGDFRLYPYPDEPSDPFIGLFGDPLGAGLPQYAVAAAHTEYRDDFPDWVDLLLAFSILTREYIRESPHRDEAFGRVCGQIAATLAEALV